MKQPAAKYPLLSMATLVQKVAGHLLEQPRGKGMQLYRDWSLAVGSRIAEHSEPVSLANGQLTIRVDSPVWQQQLQLMQEELLHKIQQRLPDKTVRSLRFRQESLRLHNPGVNKAAAEPIPMPPPHADDLRQADAWLQQVTDPELRATLHRLLLTYLTLKRNGTDPISRSNSTKTP
ncbi:MAG: DUF721 domain-containing protein [Magnetococcales bacterium]|nr:DUF721 domain-containing protein [Magnetococcales bacterium]